MCVCVCVGKRIRIRKIDFKDILIFYTAADPLCIVVTRILYFSGKENWKCCKNKNIHQDNTHMYTQDSRQFFRFLSWYGGPPQFFLKITDNSDRICIKSFFQ